MLCPWAVGQIKKWYGKDVKVFSVYRILNQPLKDFLVSHAFFLGVKTDNIQDYVANTLDAAIKEGKL